MSILAIVLGLIVALIVYYVLAHINIPQLLAGLIAVAVFLAFAFGGASY